MTRKQETGNPSAAYSTLSLGLAGAKAIVSHFVLNLELQVANKVTWRERKLSFRLTLVIHISQANEGDPFLG